MTVLGRGLIVQPVLLARTYNNDTIITLQNITLEAVAFITRPRRRSPSRRLRAVVLTVQRGRPTIKVLTSFLVLCVGRRSGCVVCGQEGVPGGVLSVFFLTVPPLWSSGKGVSLESGRSRVRLPLALRFFPGRFIPVTLKNGTPVATLPGAWRCRVSAGTGRPGVSLL